VPNSDEDTTPNYRDLDSDNDGLHDSVEGGATDENNDGVVDNPGELVDPADMPDKDNNGVSDPLEPNNDKLPESLDSDGDGVIDDVTDTDGDGIPDVVDANNDGSNDGTEDDYGNAPGLDADHDQESITSTAPTVINILANDNANIPLSQITQLTDPEHGEVAYDDGGTPTDLSDDVFVYMAEDDFVGTVTFDYKIVDAMGNEDIATVTLNVDCASSQTSDSGDAFGKASMALMMFMTMLLGLYFVRKEEEEKSV